MTARAIPHVNKDSILDSGEFLMTRSLFIKSFKEVHPEECDLQVLNKTTEKPQDLDQVDAEINRKVGSVKPDKASVLDALFSIGAIGTYVADITTDILVAKQHFQNGDTVWFILTCVFIITPSLIMQMFSCKWFNEDYLNQTWWTYMLHFFQLGTIERYLLAFWYGLKTRFTVPVLHSDYIRYLTEWRDITLLRLIEGFLEAAPQMILQLYILASQKEFILDRDWLTATSAVVSIISLSWAIVSYSQMLRLCLNDRALSFCGYGFQILYRLLMVASRVTVLVLFASAFKEYIFLVVVGHCAMMFAWLSCIDATHYSVDRDEPFLEKIFTLIVSVIYLFCFLSVHPATTKRHISIYYSITFVESAAMMSAWFPYRTLEGVLMYASFGLVFGGFFCGLLCMMLYYKYFHPNQDVTASWICCLWFSNDGGRGNSELEESTLKNVSFSYDDNDKELVVIKVRQRSGSQTGGQKTPDPDSGNRLSLPVELMRPHSPLKNRGDIDQIELEEVRDEKLKNVNGETLKCSSSFDRDKNHRTVFSDGELETCIDRGVLPRTGYVACSPANHGGRYFQHKERPKWEAHVSKTVMANAYCSYPEDGTIENKAKLGELKMGMELATTEWEVSNFDKNSNKLEKKRSTRSTKGEMFEQRPLLQRQGSKDDYFAINTSLFPVELQKHRRRSLSAMQ